MTTSSSDTAFRLRRRPRPVAAHRLRVGPTAPQLAKVTFCVRGVISPVLANIALDGLEALLRKNFSRRTGTRHLDKVHLVRYADDFIISGSSRELLVDEVKPLVATFLKTRGLELSPEKTSITHIEQGFDFLGWNVRRFRNGMLIRPSKKSVQTFMRKIRALVKEQKHLPQTALIGVLNPLIRGWANYHRCAVAGKDLPWAELADLADSMAVGEASSSQQGRSLDRASLLDNGDAPMGFRGAGAEAGNRKVG